MSFCQNGTHKLVNFIKIEFENILEFCFPNFTGNVKFVKFLKMSIFEA